MAPRDANVLHMLAEIESLGKDLTKWEEELVQHIKEKMEKKSDLTEFQYRRLTQIYEERVP